MKGVGLTTKLIRGLHRFDNKINQGLHRILPRVCFTDWNGDDDDKMELFEYHFDMV